MSATGTVNVGVSASNVNIGNNLLGTSINIGNGNTGTSNINSTTVNISNGISTGTTNIYSPAVFLGNGDTGTTRIYSPNTNVGTTTSGTTNLYSPTMNIGVAGGTIALKATTTVETLNITNPAGALAIANNITTGNVNFATTNSHTGAIYVGTSTARVGNAEFGTSGTGNVLIGSTTAPLGIRGTTITFTGTTTLGTTNVATLDATSATTGFGLGNNITTGNLNFLTNSAFSGNVYIGSNSTTRSGTADLFTAGTGTVSLGSLNASLALRGSTTTFSSALTLDDSAPSGGTQLGGIISPTFVSAASPGNIYSISLTVGSWLLIGNVNFNNITSFASLSISATSESTDNFSLATVLGNGSVGVNIVRAVNTTTTATWYLVANSGPAINTSSSSFYAVRLG